jgi:hypothetical protein
MDTREIKVAKGTKITHTVPNENGGGRTFGRTTTTQDDDGRNAFTPDFSLRLDFEGKTWVRGWTGKAVTALKRAVAAEDRKRRLDKAKADRARDKEHEDRVVKCLRQAAVAVKRAKLPRELRVAAFAAQFPGSMMPFMMYR